MKNPELKKPKMPEISEITPQWLSQNKEKFEAFDPERQRNLLGSLMYKKVDAIQNIEQEKVSKVTGMLIDTEILDLDEIIELLVNDASLQERVQEALEVIDESNDM